MQKNSKTNLLQQIPTKWAIAIVVLAIGYGLTQPVLNRQLGWNLPSIASLAGNGEEQGDESSSGGSKVSTNTGKEGNSRVTSAGSEKLDGRTPTKDPGPKVAATQTSSKPKSDSRAKGAPSSPTANTDAKSSNVARGPPSSGSTVSSNENLRYGLLKSIGSDRYISPEGLVYGRGSQEGHRLKHIERHLEDQPNRSGSHGVFYGDMGQVIRWLDDTYSRAKSGAKGTRRKDEGGRTVLEAPFSKPVGYVGGQTGKRKGNPDAKNIRLVVEGKNVITAFPY